MIGKFGTATNGTNLAVSGIKPSQKLEFTKLARTLALDRVDAKTPTFEHERNFG
jgi:hypothetical protein